ncbi:hypothetical protein VFPBJ_00094 [Purpureocillium lilacinum]|uniref:2EXR domain-containing protein n=1 Tax=Purpureocillium lilacinum TaxID=33203 RepID=A0A179H7C0_PURLI|nr:hypothetical protein VFPBJ_00094 [Purpureocillium lilacinum]
MATFHAFGRLPFELRTRIWEEAVTPRFVQVGYLRGTGKNGRSDVILHVLSPTPAPAVLHACHEARNLGLYERAFVDGEDPRYVWVNFDVDIVSIGHGDFHGFEP